jgi:hypothetical protein
MQEAGLRLWVCEFTGDNEYTLNTSFSITFFTRFGGTVPLRGTTCSQVDPINFLIAKIFTGRL